MSNIITNIKISSRYSCIIENLLSLINLHILSNKRMIECEKSFHSNVSLKLAY